MEKKYKNIEELKKLIKECEETYKPGVYRGYVQLLMKMIKLGWIEPLHLMSNIGCSWEEFYERFEQHPTFIKVDWESESEILEFICEHDPRFYITLKDRTNNEISKYPVSNMSDYLKSFSDAFDTVTNIESGYF